jgi:TolB-like protein/thioredoxin-like negative regulator of GroEL
MSLFKELKRRNVFQVAAAYLVVGWLLTEVLTTILPTLGAPDWTARAVILIFAFGFLPAVIVSWFYELTPDGIRRDLEVLPDGTRLSEPISNREYLTIALVILAVIVTGLLSARHTFDNKTASTAPATAASVAVLPFVNMSNDDDNEYFSDGLTETLLHMLTQIPNLKVAARTSSFAFKNQNKSIREIASALDVAHVLEGSVQRSGDRVRITAQLIRASDGFHVWSESYDRQVDDIFRIQDEIAEKVGYALSKSLLGDRVAGRLAGVDTTNPDAYDLYLQARNERVTYSYGGLRAAEDLLKGALLIDPDFLDAKIELATGYLQQMETGLMDPKEAFPKIRAIADQVLEKRPEDVVARASRLYADASIKGLAGDHDAMADAARQLEELVAEAPEELQTRILLVRSLLHMQQPDAALPVLQTALEQDPYNPQILFELGSLYVNLERWDEASTSLERSLEIEPAQPNAYIYLARIALQEGDGVGYVEKFLKAIEVDPRDHELPGMLAAFLYQLGLIDEGDDFRARVMAIAPTSAMAYRLELLRALGTGKEGDVLASARHAVDDNVEDRMAAFSGAVQQLLRNAARNGTVDEASAYLESRAPGILDVDAETVPPKFRRVQGMAFDAWAASLPRQEVLRRLDRMLEIAESQGMDPNKEPLSEVTILALRGRVKEAVDVALHRVFNQSVAMNLGWEQTFSQAPYAELVEDPRIQAAMQHWQSEESSLRGRVQGYLGDLQAKS